ncbi:putative thiazole-containing bacteriocin maturation protein [Paenibacillus sp. J31TS4]|uniref:putative thiazole-containing bacteriocin maturation protein n=1 Tax=Paenibacillus sp. J31TS4 TaxID=2807195 RepID=UPI001B0B9F16|nr:putative thiazole-containing bacteriocin maturation protein [Paenibacillus sp. J31TS4]GIP37088.1 putative thiazole-containing bacteriocin maturation protein [Paenibacillus sp. J31TS4]
MTNVTPAARLQVKADTFYLPSPNGNGVYFRNNVGTFQMEGEMIDRWIESLIPMFNGEATLEAITSGLSHPQRNHVYQIADALLQKGFVRDVSQDRPHPLTKAIVDKHAAQIAFLDSIGDSGAYRFACYRQARVLAVGSGPFFVSLVSALLESGLPQVHMAITDPASTNRQRLAVLAEQARQTDPEVLLEEISLPEGEEDWREAIEPFQWILYVSQEGKIEELRRLQALCRAEKKVLLPAMFLHQTGIAGPVVHPESEGCWESAWRRLHQTAVYKEPDRHVFSSTAGALLANVIVFELFKTVTGVAERGTAFFQLDLETLEGSWHPFLPHPLIRGCKAAEQVPLALEETDRSEPTRLLSYFSRLTSERTGILHTWEEGDLKQLPLSQCRVRAVDPLSEGPAELLPDQVIAGLTHEEARREAGLSGIEAYVTRLAGALVETTEIVGIGVGQTAAEGVVRGLQANLAGQLAKRQQVRRQAVTPVRLTAVEDKRCRYYLQALTAMRGMPVIGLGEGVSGFPTVWVGSGDAWFGSSGITITIALQKALKAAVQEVQNPSSRHEAQAAAEASVVLLGREAAWDLPIPSGEGAAHSDILREALQILKKNGKSLSVMDLAVEPFLKEELAGVYGVLLREEEFV